jgi:outer membrane lipoprotein-sorting protein
MKKILVILLVLVPIMVCAQNNSEAERRVKKAVSEMKRSAYKSRFSLLIYDAQTESVTKESGELIIKGSKFHMILSGNETKYDGKTQWVYLSEYNEVSITEPTSEELREVNPLAMIEHYVATERISSGENNVIMFYPKTPKTSEYFKVELQLNEQNLPSSLIVFQNNGNKVSICLDLINKCEVDDSVFVFDIAKYPNVELNDLR